MKAIRMWTPTTNSTAAAAATMTHMLSRYASLGSAVKRTDSKPMHELRVMRVTEGG